MRGIHNLKPERVIKTLERAGWCVKRQKGSHVHMKKEGKPAILSIPMHKGKPIKKGLMLDLLKISGLTEKEFLKFYNK